MYCIILYYIDIHLAHSECGDQFHNAKVSWMQNISQFDCSAQQVLKMCYNFHDLFLFITADSVQGILTPPPPPPLPPGSTVTPTTAGPPPPPGPPSSSSPTTSALHTYPNRSSPSPLPTASTLRPGSTASTTSTPSPTFALGSVHPLAHHRGEQRPVWACSRTCWSQAKESARGKS